MSRAFGPTTMLSRSVLTPNALAPLLLTQIDYFLLQGIDEQSTSPLSVAIAFESMALARLEILTVFPSNPPQFNAKVP